MVISYVKDNDMLILDNDDSIMVLFITTKYF